MTVYNAKYIGKNPGSVPIFYPGDIIVFNKSNICWVVLKSSGLAISPTGEITDYLYQKLNCYRFTRQL